MFTEKNVFLLIFFYLHKQNEQLTLKGIST